MPTLPLLAQILGLGNAAGTRSAGTLLFLGAATHVAPGRFALAQDMAWLSHPLTLALLAGLLVLEHLAERDHDVQELLSLVQYALRAAAGAVAILALAPARELDVPPMAMAAIGGAVALTTQKLRLELHRGLALLELEAVSPRRWLLRLEDGGALGVLLAVVLAPILALMLVVAGALAAFVGVMVAHRLEDRGRRSCPACGARIRKEACACPKCGAEVPVARTLELELG